MLEREQSFINEIDQILQTVLISDTTNFFKRFFVGIPGEYIQKISDTINSIKSNQNNGNQKVNDVLLLCTQLGWIEIYSNANAGNKNIKNLVTELRAATANFIRDLRDISAQLLSDKNNLTITRDNLAKDKSGLTSERDALTKDRANLITERDSLSKDKSSLIAERDSLRKAKEELIAERNRLAKEKEDFAAANRLENDLNKLANEKSAMSYALAISDKDKELNEKNRELKDKDRIIQEFSQLNQINVGEIDKLKKDLEDTEKTLQRRDKDNTKKDMHIITLEHIVTVFNELLIPFEHRTIKDSPCRLENMNEEKLTKFLAVMRGMLPPSDVVYATTTRILEELQLIPDNKIVQGLHHPSFWNSNGSLPRAITYNTSPKALKTPTQPVISNDEKMIENTTVHELGSPTPDHFTPSQNEATPKRKHDKAFLDSKENGNATEKVQKHSNGSDERSSSPGLNGMK